jgi:hypothetical protein
MTARNDDGLDTEVATPDLSVYSSLADRPVVIDDDVPPPTQSRLTVLVVLAAVLVLAAIVAAIVVVARGGDDSPADTVTKADGGAKADQQSGTGTGVPAALSISVDAPAAVVAGQTARFVVHYRDGEGIFSGGSEDWGDIGTSSISEAKCESSTPAADALDATYVVRHKWSEVGTYPVAIGVTTYTCQAGQAVPETKTTTLQVSVGPR